MILKIIQTKRLILIPVTEDIINYEINKGKLPDALSGIFIPENWPHESVTTDVNLTFQALLKQNRLFSFYWISNSDRENQVLIGSRGFIVHENADFELGYSVLKQYENQGYTTGAVETLLEWYKESGFKETVIAKTEPENYPSIKVLEKNGFSRSEFKEESGLGLVEIL
ncbi:GNAT family N-acetyltransferase [Methanolacinia petrolearia]|uniref:GNAT family N-acetyltransferase n=1 Tax=Methanolacinia petrolearia TaxID=54120 RepID=UPI003BAA9337